MGQAGHSRPETLLVLPPPATCSIEAEDAADSLIVGRSAAAAAFSAVLFWLARAILAVSTVHLVYNVTLIFLFGEAAAFYVQVFNDAPSPPSEPLSLPDLVWPTVLVGGYMLMMPACKACMQALTAVTLSLTRANNNPGTISGHCGCLKVLSAGFVREEVRLWQALLNLMLSFPLGALLYYGLTLPGLWAQLVFIVVSFTVAPMYLLWPLVVKVYRGAVVVNTVPPPPIELRAVWARPEVRRS
jgi:hypothetical protein